MSEREKSPIFLTKEIKLDDDIVLTNNDIQEEISSGSQLGVAIGDSRMTLYSPENRPTHAIVPNFKMHPDSEPLAVAIVFQQEKLRFFILKSDSKALQDFIVRHASKNK